MSVLEVVLDADIERKTLLQREQELLILQQEVVETTTTTTDNNNHHQNMTMEMILQELSDIQERMQFLNLSTAESRAASILAGLQFTEVMQHASTASLSGGWRMRVALAAALFIEPDILMLDEPTNHLDLEAVLWLENYCLQYEKTILLVSHDRAFLNEICTDIILFDKLKLTYYRGNYDSYFATRQELEIVQQKQHEAQQVKLQHMQEFVDKFRFNAKRASLVQSRIKAMEKEIVIEAVEEEEHFSFSFSDAGQLGNNNHSVVY
jgi:ATP-binding cassette, subfamily F, member 3